MTHMLVSAERIFLNGEWQASVAIDVDKAGLVRAVGPISELGRPDHMLTGRAILPGMVNAHSHAFQRLLRGRTQIASPSEDNFWTWRDVMYRVAGKLDPTHVYNVTRQAFIELLLAGVTCVGEFHYIHHQPGGVPYDDPNELAWSVAQAARDAGIRLCLLRVVYLRGDFDTPPSELQKRFCDASLDMAAERLDSLQKRLLMSANNTVAWGLAPHSLRAVPIDAVVALKTRYGHQPFHIHVSEQLKEVDRCLQHHGRRPVQLLADHGVLDGVTTLVHATHIVESEAQAIAQGGSIVCVCPSTEADLGDGFAPATLLHAHGVKMALGSDGQTLLSIVEEARRLEMHERLVTRRRNVLGGAHHDVAQTLFDFATVNGARSLGIETGQLVRGHWADFFSVDLNDPALAGSDDASLLASFVFSSDSRAIRDVVVGGKFVVIEGRHTGQQESQRAYRETARALLS